MIQKLRESCRGLLESGTVKAVLGYGQRGEDGPVHMVFITKPEDVGRLVWNSRCYQNLTVYLTKPEVRSYEKVAIVVKGCDARALVVLEQEKQIDRKKMHVIGMACDGVGEPQAPKCGYCEAHMPTNVDETIGESAATPAGNDGVFADLDALLAKSPAERMAYWKEQLARCIKCYACRAVCPTCYCNKCIVDKNRPQCIDSSATLMGNFSWHITKAFHQAGRCTGCGECTRVCPVHIPLHLLNKSMSRAANTAFGTRAGTDPQTPPPVGSYSLQDKENFIL